METDHKPLVGIFGDKPMADIDNKRLAKLKEKTMWWRFDYMEFLFPPNFELFLGNPILLTIHIKRLLMFECIGTKV